MKNVAVITGGAKGIGKAIALELALKGSRVIIFDIDSEAMRKAVLEMQSQGLEADWQHVDVSKVEQVRDAVDSVFEKNGSIDILVNNAGILSRANILELDEEEWDRVMDCNVRSAVFMTQGVLKYMIRKKSGRIINISSLAGRNGGIKTGTVYSVSKAAIIGLTKRTARFAAQYKVTVNCVAPGTTLTDMVNGFSPEEKESLKTFIPMGELITPKQVARAVSFLASESSQSITGVVLDVNGGMYF